MKGRHFRSLSKEKVKSKFQEFEMSAAGLQYVPPVFDSSYSIAFSSLSLCDSCYDFFDCHLCQISSKIPCTVLRWESIMIQGVRIVTVIIIFILLQCNFFRGWFFSHIRMQLCDATCLWFQRGDLSEKDIAHVIYFCSNIAMAVYINWQWHTLIIH